MVDPWLNHPAGKDVVERSSAVLGWDVAATSRDPEALERTEVVQLAVFVCDLAAYAVLSAEGVRCDIAAGHSLGEYAALVAAGVVELEPGLGGAGRAGRGDGQGLAREPRRDDRADRRVPGGGRRDLRGGGARRRPRGGEREQREADRPVGLGLGDRARRGAGPEPRGEGDPAVRRRRLPLAAHGARAGPVREVLSRVEFHAPSFPIVPNVSATPTTQPSALRDCCRATWSRRSAGTPRCARWRTPA